MKATVTVRPLRSAECSRPGCSRPADPGRECAWHDTLRRVADTAAAKEHAAACAEWMERDHGADRAVLLTWAQEWTDLHAAFVRNGRTADQADSVLYDAVRMWTHPAARVSLVFLLPKLRDAVDRLAQLHAGLLDPREVCEGTAWLSVTDTRREIAEELLRDDIAEALLPLATGRTS